MQSENEYGDLGSLLRDRARRTAPPRPDFPAVYERAGELSRRDSGTSFSSHAFTRNGTVAPGTGTGTPVSTGSSLTDPRSDVRPGNGTASVWWSFLPGTRNLPAKNRDTLPGSGRIPGIPGMASRRHRLFFALSCAAAISCAVGLGFVAGRLFRSSPYPGVVAASDFLTGFNFGSERDSRSFVDSDSLSPDTVMEEYIDYVWGSPPRSGLVMTVRYDVGLYLSDLWSAGDGVSR